MSLSWLWWETPGPRDESWRRKQCVGSGRGSVMPQCSSFVSNTNFKMITPGRSLTTSLTCTNKMKHLPSAPVAPDCFENNKFLVKKRVGTLFCFALLGFRLKYQVRFGTPHFGRMPASQTWLAKHFWPWSMVRNTFYLTTVCLSVCLKSLKISIYFNTCNASWYFLF